MQVNKQQTSEEVGERSRHTGNANALGQCGGGKEEERSRPDAFAILRTRAAF